MGLFPTSKYDLEACATLANASDGEVGPLVPQLLEWLQDMNWPVAVHVRDRLARMSAELVEPVRKVLIGNDETWKYWLVSSLLPETDSRVVSALSAELKRLAFCPTASEKSEEVDMLARELLERKDNGA